MCIAAAPLAYASLAASAIGTAVSVYGSVQQGKAAQGQANYQATVDRNNKIISDRYAADAIERGKEAEADQRRKTQQIIANQRVGFAANGIDLGSDVVSETLSDSAMLGELDALTIRSNAAREAYGYQVQGMNYEASATNQILAGKNARSAGRTAAMSTLLSGAASVGNSYADYKSKGIL